MGSPEEDVFNEVKEEVEKELRQKYLGDIDRLRRELASELSGALSRKLVEHMNLKREGYKSMLLNGISMLIGGGGDGLEEEVSMLFDDVFSSMLTDLAKLIPEVVEGRLKWSGGDALDEIVRRIEELVEKAAELETRKRMGAAMESGLVQRLINELTRRDKALRALRYLEVQGPKTSVEVANFLGVADPTARDYLKRLEAVGYVKRLAGRPVKFKFVKAPWTLEESGEG